MIDINEFLPRTQADRYNHAVLEQLIELNKNIKKLIPVEQQEDKPKKVKAKRGEVNV